MGEVARLDKRRDPELQPEPLVFSYLQPAPGLERKQFAAFSGSARSPINTILKKKGLLFGEGSEAVLQKQEQDAGTPLLTSTVATRAQLQIASINLTSTVGRALLAKLPVSFLLAIEFRACSLVDSALQSLQACPRLRHLCLAANSLEQLPQLGHMRSLQFLDLQGNRISSLSGLDRHSVFAAFPRSLRYISLLDNPIAADGGQQYRALLAGLLVSLLAVDRHVVADEERLNVLFNAPFCAGHPRMRLHPALLAYPAPRPHQPAVQLDAWNSAYGLGAAPAVAPSPRSKLEAEAQAAGLLECRLDARIACLARHYACTNPVPTMQRLFRAALQRKRERLARLPPRSIRLLVKAQASIRRYLLYRRLRAEMNTLLLAGADKRDLVGGAGAGGSQGGGGASQAISLRRLSCASTIAAWWRALALRRRALRAARVIQRAVRWSRLRCRESLAYVLRRGLRGIVVPTFFRDDLEYLLVSRALALNFVCGGIACLSVCAPFFPHLPPFLFSSPSSLRLPTHLAVRPDRPPRLPQEQLQRAAPALHAAAPARTHGPGPGRRQHEGQYQHQPSRRHVHHCLADRRRKPPWPRSPRRSACRRRRRPSPQPLPFPGLAPPISLPP